MMRLDHSMERLHAKLSKWWLLMFAAVLVVDALNVASAISAYHDHVFGWGVAHFFGFLLALPLIALAALVLAAHIWLALTLGLNPTWMRRPTVLLLTLGVFVMWLPRDLWLVFV